MAMSILMLPLNVPAIDQLDAPVTVNDSLGSDDDRDAIKSAVEALEKGSSEFVERRMNASVRRMMTGQDVDLIDSAMKQQDSDVSTPVS